jgi:hypothetical protein
MADDPAIGRRAFIFKLSKSGDGGPAGSRRRQGRGPVAALGHDSHRDGVIKGPNLCAPNAGNTFWTLGSDDNAFIGSGQMERHALGLGEWIGCEFREIIQLGVEVSHIDWQGCAVRLWLRRELDAAIQPRARYRRFETAETKASR